MAFIGKDQTSEEYLDPKPFIQGRSRAGNLTRGFLFRLVNWEAQAHKRAFYPDAFDATSGPYCFIDLWPWLWHKNIVCVTEFLQWYLSFTRPIVAVTYSRLVNNITLADFRHGNGVRMSSFISVVGTATIQYYDHDDETMQPTEDSAFINIPHIHPGRDKYGPQAPELRRVIDLTMQYTFLVGDVTLEVLDAHDEEDEDDEQPPSRKQLCEEILARVESLCTASKPHKEFYANLQQARRDLIAYFQTTMASHLEEQPVLTADGRLKMISLRQAEGASRSAVRKEQLEALWEENLPDLHTTIAHEDDQRDSWMKAMSRVPQHQYYYLYLLSQRVPDPTTAELLERFKPVEAQGDDWMQDDAFRPAAAIAAGVFIDQERATDKTVELVGGKGPDKFLQPAECQGRSLKVFANGKFSIRWVNADGDDVTSRLLCKPAIPKTSIGRFLYFTAAGIDIVGPNQQSFHPVLFGKRIADASLNIRSFATDPAVKELWTTACTAHNIPTNALEDIAVDADTVDYGKKKGLAALVTNAQTEKPPQNEPPKRIDAIWLLDQFLLSRDHLANGGHFRTATTDKFPDSTEDLQAFVAMLKQPEYIKHPYTDWWLKYLDIDNPQVAVLAKNLPMLRSSICVNQQEKSKSLRINTKRVSKDSSKGVQVHERYYILGPPGSRLTDPFTTGSDQSCISDEARKKAKKAAATTAAGGEAADEDAASSKPKKKGVKATDTGLQAPFGSLKELKGKKRKAKAAGHAGGEEAAFPEPTTERKRKRHQPAGDDEDDDDDDADDDIGVLPASAASRKKKQPIKKQKRGKHVAHDDDDDDGERYPLESLVSRKLTYRRVIGGQESYSGRGKPRSGCTSSLYIIIACIVDRVGAFIAIGTCSQLQVACRP